MVGIAAWAYAKHGAHGVDDAEAYRANGGDPGADPHQGFSPDFVAEHSEGQVAEDCKRTQSLRCLPGNQVVVGVAAWTCGG